MAAAVVLVTVWMKRRAVRVVRVVHVEILTQSVDVLKDVWVRSSTCQSRVTDWTRSACLQEGRMRVLRQGLLCWKRTTKVSAVSEGLKPRRLA